MSTLKVRSVQRVLCSAYLQFDGHSIDALLESAAAGNGHGFDFENATVSRVGDCE